MGVDFSSLDLSSPGFSSLDLFFDNRYSVVVYDRVIRRCAMKKNLLLALRSLQPKKAYAYAESQLPVG